MLKDMNGLLDGLVNGLVLLDREGYIIYSNPSISTISGYSSADLVNQHLRILYDDDSIRADYDLDMARKNEGFLSEGWRNFC